MKRILIWVLASAVLCIAACNHDDLNIPDAKQYSMLYMPQAHQYPNVYNVYVVDSPQVINCNAFLGGPSSAKGAITVTFKVDTTLVDSFNIRNGTDYSTLPADAWTLDSGVAVIGARQLISSGVHVILHPAGLKVNHSYLLPVTIQQASGDYAINADMGTTYYLISGAYPPGEVIPWNDFTSIMSYGNSWIVVKSDGTVWSYPTDAAGNFGPPAKLAEGWKNYDPVILYGNAIIARDGGNLLRFAIAGDGSIGASTNIGTGWDIFSQIFGYKGSLITINKNDGSLWRYPLDDAGIFGTGAPIGQGWQAVNVLFGSATAIIAVVGGNLWQYPLDEYGNFDYGNIRQIGAGWDIFSVLFYDSKDNAVVGRKPDGTLWRYPFASDGSIGAATQIGK